MLLRLLLLIHGIWLQSTKPVDEPVDMAYHGIVKSVYWTRYDGDFIVTMYRDVGNPITVRATSHGRTSPGAEFYKNCDSEDDYENEDEGEIGNRWGSLEEHPEWFCAMLGLPAEKVADWLLK